jgi:hypothetical protein
MACAVIAAVVETHLKAFHYLVKLSYCRSQLPRSSRYPWGPDDHDKFRLRCTDFKRRARVRINWQLAADMAGCMDQTIDAANASSGLPNVTTTMGKRMQYLRRKFKSCLHRCCAAIKNFTPANCGYK